MTTTRTAQPTLRDILEGRSVLSQPLTRSEQAEVAALLGFRLAEVAAATTPAPRAPLSEASAARVAAAAARRAERIAR